MKAVVFNCTVLLLVVTVAAELGKDPTVCTNRFKTCLRRFDKEECFSIRHRCIVQHCIYRARDSTVRTRPVKLAACYARYAVPSFFVQY
ncbi:hypothetical protein ScPMuIL_003421 [Solemya velum]